jgi:hypothetical protein
MNLQTVAQTRLWSADAPWTRALWQRTRRSSEWATAEGSITMTGLPSILHRYRRPLLSSFMPHLIKRIYLRKTTPSNVYSVCKRSWRRAWASALCSWFMWALCVIKLPMGVVVKHVLLHFWSSCYPDVYDPLYVSLWPISNNFMFIYGLLSKVFSLSDYSYSKIKN